MNLEISKTHLLPAAPKRGFMMVDLFVGIAIIGLAILPLAYFYVRETRLLRAEYFRGVAMEIVDGETEILAAGAWRGVPEGSQPYTVDARAAAVLPPGHFLLTRNGNQLRLEWKADEHQGIGTVTREVTVK